MKILIAGGGTGGHINPAIAIANAACERYENCQVLFAGTKRGLEKELVPQAGYNIEFIEAEGLRRKISAANIKALYKTAKGYIKAGRIIKKFRPDAVIGTGGYVSGPVVLAAAKAKIPTLIHEQNALAGITSRLLSGYVDGICVAFNNKNILGHPEKTIVTGNPVRKGFKTVNRGECRKELGIEENELFVLCVSGSLGAEKINNCICDYILSEGEKIDYHFLTVTGARYYDSVKERLSGIKNPRIHIKKYIYDMEKYLCAADVVISRSGALFMSEIAYLGKPSILIPSPNVAENHQEHNADMFVEAGCSVKISESELTKETLGAALKRLTSDSELLKKMAEAAYGEGIRNADGMILDALDEIITRKEKNA